MLWLVVIALGMSAVSLYYYLHVLKQIYIREPRPGPGAMPTPILCQVALVLLALAVVVLGVVPDLLLRPLLSTMQASGL